MAVHRGSSLLVACGARARTSCASEEHDRSGLASRIARREFSPRGQHSRPFKLPWRTCCSSPDCQQQMDVSQVRQLTALSSAKPRFQVDGSCTLPGGWHIHDHVVVCLFHGGAKITAGGALVKLGGTFMATQCASNLLWRSGPFLLTALSSRCLPDSFVLAQAPSAPHRFRGHSGGALLTFGASLIMLSRRRWGRGSSPAIHPRPSASNKPPCAS